nr:unnamed protein product [Callosobruchus analis]
MCLLLEDPDTKVFGEYFHTNYFFKRKMWAYCCRKSCGINTNMFIESLHKTIKYFYLEGKRVQCLDKPQVVERFIKNVKGKPSSHIKEISNRHSSAKTLNCELYIIENGVYIVKTEEKEYVVRRQGGCCCLLKCSFCNICLHSYSCECADFFILNTICKHIHYVANSEIDVHLQTFGSQSSKISPIKKNIDTILTNINAESTKMIEENDVQSTAQLQKNLMHVNTLIRSNKEKSSIKQNKQVVKEPPNKKLKKQFYFSCKYDAFVAAFTWKVYHICTRNMVSFGSSKGSMVETLIFESPVQEEAEPSPIPENGVPYIPEPDPSECQ